MNIESWERNYRAVVRRYSSKYVFLKISQISQENTCVGVWRPEALLRRDPNTGVFLWDLRNF